MNTNTNTTKNIDIKIYKINLTTKEREYFRINEIQVDYQSRQIILISNDIMRSLINFHQLPFFEKQQHSNYVSSNYISFNYKIEYGDMKKLILYIQNNYPDILY